MLRNPSNNSQNPLANTQESVNLTGLKRFILSCLFNWSWTFQAQVWHLSSTFPPLCSSHSLRAVAITHPPPSCLISSYFPDKWFSYAQVLILPAVPICLLSPLFLYQMPNRKSVNSQVKISLQHSDTFLHSSNASPLTQYGQCSVWYALNPAEDIRVNIRILTWYINLSS